MASLASRDHAYDTSTLIPFLQTYSPAWTGTNVSGLIYNYAIYADNVARTFAAYPSGIKGGLVSRLISVSLNQKSVEAVVFWQCRFPKKQTKYGDCYYYRSSTSDEIWSVSRHYWQEQSERFLLDQETYSVKPLNTDLAEPVAQTHAMSGLAGSRGITAALSARANAYRHSNLPAYLRTFSPSFTITDVNGASHGFKEVKAGVSSRFAKYPAGIDRGVLFNVISTKKSGHYVEATVRARYVYPAKPTKFGNCYTYRTITSAEVWTASGNQWLERSDQHLYDQMTYSLKPVAR